MKQNHRLLKQKSRIFSNHCNLPVRSTALLNNICTKKEKKLEHALIVAIKGQDEFPLREISRDLNQVFGSS